MPSTLTDITEPGTSRFLTIREGDKDLKLHYNDVGSGDETIVLLHGSGPGATGWANFSRNVEPLAQAGYRVVLMDCPGWGKSGPVVSTQSRSELNARALKSLVDELKLDRVHIVGNSMGAHTAVAFALANPARVGKLVLMGGGVSGPSIFVPQPTEGIKLIGALYRQPTLENLKKMLSVFVYDSSVLTDDLVKARLDNMLSQPEHLENFVKSAEAGVHQFPDLSHRLREIQAQTLVIWGRDDRFLPLDLGLRLVWNLPNAELHVFSRCGHWAQWEHAEKFNRMVLDFLEH
jgi:2-hydroxy-6-oxonona-2,4-dienedioate hydrolase